MRRASRRATGWIAVLLVLPLAVAPAAARAEGADPGADEAWLELFDVATYLVDRAERDRAMELEPPEPASWKQGDPVRLFARPESLQVSLRAGVGGASAVAARLEDLIFLGVDRKLVVRLSDGTRIEVQERSARLPEGLEERVDEEIGLIFPADETLVFGREPGA